MSKKRINILPIINAWLDQSIDTDVERGFLVSWLTGKVSNRGAFKPLLLEEAELAADCMIAAGIGNEEEQQGTVYCNCSYAE